jgi:hypothetical protein
MRAFRVLRFLHIKNRQSYLGKVTPRNTIFTIGHF